MKKISLLPQSMLAMAAITLATGAAARAQYTFIPLSVPGATMTFPQGISNDNLIVGQYGTSTGMTYGFTFNPATGVYTSIKSRAQVIANAANKAGTIVGYYISGGAAYGMVDTDGVQSTYSEPGCTNTEINGINDYGSGTMTGTCVAPNGNPVAWIGSPWNQNIACANLGASSVLPAAINNFGIVGGSYSRGTGENVSVEGFLSTAFGECTAFSYPFSTYTGVGGLNDVGTISGSYSPDGNTWNGFIYNDTYTTVNAPGAVSTYIYQINNNNWFVGWYVDAQNKNHGFYAVPTSGPGVE